MRRCQDTILIRKLSKNLDHQTSIKHSTKYDEKIMKESMFYNFPVLKYNIKTNNNIT